jgi:hypothetical protein
MSKEIETQKDLEWIDINPIEVKRKITFRNGHELVVYDVSKVQVSTMIRLKHRDGVISYCPDQVMYEDCIVRDSTQMEKDRSKQERMWDRINLLSK